MLNVSIYGMANIAATKTFSFALNTALGKSMTKWKKFSCDVFCHLGQQWS